jgi:hypothetical protein
VAAPAQTTPDAQDPSATADPIALAAFVSRRAGRVLAYLDAVATPEEALRGTGEAFAAYRLARAADPDAEAPATALLRATRRAATTHAENPHRPEGRERPARRTKACEAMPRLLVAWTEGRLPEGDVERLVHHLQECPDCRALRDAFDRAELGYRGGETVELDGTEVGVVASAMALAVATTEPVQGVHADPATARGGRTSLPSRPDVGGASVSPIGRRTAIPEPPVSLPDLSGGSTVPTTPRPTAPRPDVLTRTTGVPAPPTAVPTPPDVGADVPIRSTHEGPPTGEDARPRHDDQGGAVPSEEAVDPLGPEALGYAVPRRGLPRPEKRTARPRVRRRRRTPRTAPATKADAPVAADAVETGRGVDGADERLAVPVSDDGAADRTGSAPPAPEDRSERTAEAPVVVSAASRSVDVPESPVVAATGRERGLTTTGRRILEVPIVRQLGVPAVLLLAVLIAALIAAGAFAGRDDGSVAPVPRPTIPTVPSDPNQIPPLK